MSAPLLPFHSQLATSKLDEADDVVGENVYRCNSTLCVLKANRIPTTTLVVIILLYAVELCTLVVVGYIALDESANSDYNLKVIAFGSLYAVVAIISSIYKPFFDFIRFVACIIHNKAEHNKIRMTKFKTFVLVMEALVTGFTLFALLVLIPQQGDVISIVVNCTGILCVSNLDEQVFGTFSVIYYGIPQVVKRVEDADIYDWLKWIIPPILIVCGYSMIIIVSIFWLPRPKPNM
jgi:hypothetical protein